MILHKPVLVNEVLTYLNPQPNQTYIDVTFGSGGHTRAILEKESTSTVIALDWDICSLETHGAPLQEKYGDRLKLVWGNFALLYKIVKKEGIKQVDGILADFGTSQMHLMERAGFSFSRDTPLDMRMSPSHQRMTAADIIATASEEKLRQIFWQLGEERYARQIARAIMQERKKKAIKTTKQLASLIEWVVPLSKRVRGFHPATRIFQALRIYVNKELDNIVSFLSAAIRILKPGGRIVCISFHSLEDRIVKQFFVEQEQRGVLEIVTPRVVVPTQQEVRMNPSARSAKLRAARICV